MNMDRKTFLKKGILSLGEMFLHPGSLMAGPAEEAPLRPPGFAEEKVASCAGCDRCLNACPGELLVKRKGVEGPLFDPSRGGCTFCHLCAGACPNGVLPFPESGKPQRLGLAVPDNRHCLGQRGGCFTCLEQCPKEAITIEPGEGIRVNYDRCDGCGVCEHVCPLAPAALRIKRLGTVKNT